MPTRIIGCAQAALFLLSLAIALGSLDSASAAPPVIARYDFADPGKKISDVSNHSPPMQLTVRSKQRQSQRAGALKLDGRTIALAESGNEKLMRRLRDSGSLSIEIWLTSANRKQSGPARIVTFSTDTSNRNWTVGQDGDRFEVRLRTTKTNKNGLPALASPARAVRTKRTHLVYTRSRDGATALFLDGKLVASGEAKGTFSNWDSKARLAIGDEVTRERPWKGSMHQLTIYSGSLTPSEVRTQFQSGLDENALPNEPTPQQLANAHFESKIAPLLAKKCLECHDLASAEGDLVLDRKEPAFSSAIVPGDASNSDVWISVEDDSMPHNRAPLTAEEKMLLKQWIDDGAVWSLDWIDPADYSHDADKKDTFVRRLTASEYIRSVQTAVGVDIAYQARKRLPPDLRADGFRNTAYNLTVDLGHIEAYNRLAKQIVSQMNPPKYAKRFWDKARLTDRDMRGLIQNMGTWILRGPLNDQEIAFYRGISTTTVSAGGDYGDAVGATIEAMLQSPRFLYRMESQREDGYVDSLDDYELASRISYILWGAPPDQSLMDAAAEGTLSDPDVVKSQIERLLDDERAEQRSMDFLQQWLHLDHLQSLRPDAERFRYWDGTLASQMREETLAFFRHIVWDQRRPLSDLIDAQITFCRPELAEHYGLEVNGNELSRYDLTDVPERGGLLTQGSLLTIGGDDGSMVTRGLFVLHELLRGVVNDPPPCVDTTPIPTKAGVTARTISQARLDNEACGGCHARFEPLAFGLEKYDGLGAFSERDHHQNPLREDGNLLIPGTAEPVSYNNSRELMKLLAASNRVQETLVWKVTQFAIGRPLTSADAPIVRRIHRRSQENGGTYQSIMTEIVMSPLVNPKSQ